MVSNKKQKRINNMKKRKKNMNEKTREKVKRFE